MRGNRSGFSMVELIVVVVIIGILSTIAVAQLVDRGSYDVPAFAQQTRRMLGFGQNMAIAQNRPVYAHILPNRVALCFAAVGPDGICSAPVPAPGAANSASQATLSACGSSTWYCEAVPSGVTAVSPLTLIFFDQQGRPFSGADPVDSDNSTFATLNIAINGDGISDNVIVEHETGYVH